MSKSQREEHLQHLIIAKGPRWSAAPSNPVPPLCSDCPTWVIWSCEDRIPKELQETSPYLEISCRPWRVPPCITCGATSPLLAPLSLASWRQLAGVVRSKGSAWGHTLLAQTARNSPGASGASQNRHSPHHGAAAIGSHSMELATLHFCSSAYRPSPQPCCLCPAWQREHTGETVRAGCACDIQRLQ